MRATINSSSYKSTFKVSKVQRPFHQRLTPLAWFCVGLAGMGLLAIAWIISSTVLSSYNGTENLAKRLASMGIAVPAPVVAPVQNSSTQTQAKVQATVKPAVVESAKPKPTALPAPTAAPVLAPTANPDMPMTAQTVAPLIKDVKAYFVATRNLAPKMFLAKQKELQQQFIAGTELLAGQLFVEKPQDYFLPREGDLEIKVLRIAADGARAQVQITTRNWVGDLYSLKTQKLLQRNLRQPDSARVYDLAFDKAIGSWKLATLVKTEKI